MGSRMTEFDRNTQNEKQTHPRVEGRKTTTYATHFIIQDSLEHFSYCFSLAELKPEKGRLPELPSFRVCMKTR